MRLSNVDAATANTYVAKAVAGGVFTSNSDNVLVPMALAQVNGLTKMEFPVHFIQAMVDNPLL